MLSIDNVPRLGLIALGLSYLVNLAVKRFRGARNPDRRLARLESLQLLGFGGMLGSLGLLWVFMQIHAPSVVIYIFIGGVVSGMVLCVGAYVVAWRP